MLNEIINKYEKFSDTLILEIVYHVVGNSRRIEVVINCMNALNNYEYEKIKLTFNDVVSMRFNENENQSSTVINSALLSENNGIIVFDFFPLIYGESSLKENENSDLKIKCREVSYIVLE
jgi:hypothetical protein